MCGSRGFEDHQWIDRQEGKIPIKCRWLGRRKRKFQDAIWMPWIERNDYTQSNHIKEEKRWRYTMKVNSLQRNEWFDSFAQNEILLRLSRATEGRWTRAPLKVVILSFKRLDFHLPTGQKLNQTFNSPFFVSRNPLKLSDKSKERICGQVKRTHPFLVDKFSFTPTQNVSLTRSRPWL